MSIQTYRAASMQQAIRLVKEDLGPDALIVDVRRVSNVVPGENRLGDVEISAMRAESQPVPPPAENSLPQIEQLAAAVRDHRHKGPHRQPPIDQRHQRAQTGPNHYKWLTASLARMGIDTILAEQLFEAYTANQPGDRLAAFATLIESSLSMQDLGINEHRRMTAVLIGPSGVGKTTTIAKLATVLSQRQNRRVALITADTYRVGAVAQLQAFAEILELPFHKAYQRDDLAEALEATADADVVLVDTPGCNPYDQEMLKELRQLLGFHDPFTCYLTLAMTGDFSELVEAGRRFSLLNPTGLIVTKMDETTRSAGVVGLARHLSLPLSYICSGPDVPQDIGLATPTLLAELVLRALNHSQPRPATRSLK